MYIRIKSFPIFLGNHATTPRSKVLLINQTPQTSQRFLAKKLGEGLGNIFFNVTCENQQRTDERLPTQSMTVLLFDVVNPKEFLLFLLTSLLWSA